MAGGARLVAEDDLTKEVDELLFELLLLLLALAAWWINEVELCQFAGTTTLRGCEVGGQGVPGGRK